MVLTGAQALLRQGRLEGRQEAREEAWQEVIEILLILLEDKFGELPEKVIATVNAMSPARMKELAHRILSAQTLSDLNLEE